MFLDVLFGSSPVDAYRAYEVASCPKVLIGEESLLPAEFVVKTNGRFSFQKSHDVCDAVFGRDGENEMNVIRACITLNHRYLFLLCKLTNDLPRPLTYVSEQNLLPVFGHDDDVVCTIPRHMSGMVEDGC